jgi:hypothetical protein
MDHDLNQTCEESRLRLIIGFLVVAVIVLLVYLPPFIKGDVYFSSDTTDLNYVTLRSHVNDLQEHGFVAWTEKLATGFYRAADPTTAVNSPRTIIFRLIKGYDAQSVTILIYALWGALGAYILGYLLGGKLHNAIFFGVAWPLSGEVISMAGNIPYFISSAWLPWVFAAWIAIKSRPARIALTGFCLGMISIDGDLFGTGLSFAVISMVSFLCPFSKNRKNEIIDLLLSIFLALFLAAAAWMPAVEYLSESKRADGMSTELITSFSLNPKRLLNIFAPRFFGQFHEQSFWGKEWTSSLLGHGLWFQTIYLGMLTPFLAVLSLFAKDRTLKIRAFSLFFVMTVFILLSFGRFFPPTLWLMENIPGFDLFRYPAKLFTYGSFLILCAAVLGLKELEATISAGREKIPVIVFTVSVTIFFVALITTASDSVETIKALSQRPDQSFLRIKQDFIRLGAAILIVPAIYFLLQKFEDLRRNSILVIVAVIIIDIFTASPVLNLAPKEDLDKKSVLAQKIRNSGPGRVYVSEKLKYFMQSGPRTAIAPHWGMLEGLEDAFCISAAIPNMIFKMYDQSFFETHQEKALETFCIRYIVARAKPKIRWIEDAQKTGLIEVLEIYPQQNLAVYKTNKVYPKTLITRDAEYLDSKYDALEKALFDKDNNKVFISPKPDDKFTSEIQNTTATGKDEVLGYSRKTGDDLSVEVYAEHPSWLIIREAYHKGWAAKVNDIATPIYYADGIGRAVYVGPGKSVVSFEFNPAGIRFGRPVSFAACLIIISLLLISFKNRMKQPAKL